MENEYTTITYRGIRPVDPDGRNALRNPERGLRYEMVIAKTPGDFCPWKRSWRFDRFKEDGVTVSQAYCYLSQFWNCPISQEKLNALEADFSAARQAGVKYLLRFAYEFDACRLCPDMARLKQHIEQLQPVLDRNWDVIYALQCGWMGLWGEFHSNIRNLSSDFSACAEIIRWTLNILPPDRFAMMRYPRRIHQVLQEFGGNPELTCGNAFSQDPAAKIGFFNDGTLADKTDGGTFPDAPYYGAAGNPDFDFITRRAPYVPVGGELFWNHTCDAKYASGARAMERFRLHHYTTFSYVHGFSQLNGNPADPEGSKGTIDFWKETPVSAEELNGKGYSFSPDYFYGTQSRSAFEFIRDHLGYRLEAVSLTYTPRVQAGNVFHAELKIINRGFAVMINPREFYFVLADGDGNMFEIPTGVNGQTFQPYEPGDAGFKPLEHIVSADFIIPENTNTAEMTLYLWAPDSRMRYRGDYAVRLASNTPWTEILGHGMNTLAKVQIDASEKYKSPLPAVLDESLTVHYSPVRPTDLEVRSMPDGLNLKAETAQYDSVMRRGRTYHVRLNVLCERAGVSGRCCFALCHGSGQVFEFASDTEAADFQAGRIRSVSAAVLIPEDLPEGAWTLGFWIPSAEESKRYDISSSVRLNNTVEWYDIGGRGINNLGTVWLVKS